MTDLPNPASHTDTLEAGLVALKQGSYAEAIPKLENYLTSLATGSEVNDPQALKARMGLIVAYDRTQQPERAIACCQSLITSSHAKVKTWADRTLADLHDRYPDLSLQAAAVPPTSDSTEEFVPLQPTGFVPLKPGAEATSTRPVFTPPGGRKPEQTESQEDDRRRGSKGEPEPGVRLSTHPEARTNRSSVQQRESRRSEEINQSTAPTTPASSLSAIPVRPPAGRAQKWQSLDKLAPFPLVAAQVGTAIALFLTFCLLKILSTVLPTLWFKVKINVLGWSSYPPDTTIPVVLFGLVLAGLWVASPWILDVLLRGLYGMKPLSTAALARYSPETHRLIQRFCQQRRLPLVKLRMLPTQAPLAFTYGSLPNLARIVVSQGLLEQLADDEIATIYASELGHIHHGDFSLMSLVAVVMHLPYGLYQLAAQGSDWLQGRSHLRRRESVYISTALGIAADLLAIVAALSYGLYWILRWTGLGLSKQRVAYSDRFASNLTGNPNGFTRALLKIATGTAQAVQKHQHTSYALEGLELLSPLSYRTALSLGSLAPYIAWTTLLTWDRINPSRHWLALNQSQSLLGDRLYALDRYAQEWQLASELELTALPNSTSGWRLPFPQAAPFVGLGVGLGLALGFWLIGWGTYLSGLQQLTWLASDYKLFGGLPLIGFGIGTILRFNRFFPDLAALINSQSRPAPVESPPLPSPLPDFLSQPQRSSEGQPTVLEGILLGRQGAGNGLAQDLLLHTEAGDLKLHYCAQVGVMGNLLQYTQLVNLVGQPVVAIGWLRRGATAWMDVDILSGLGGKSVSSGHQIWAVILASVATLTGIVLIL